MEAGRYRKLVGLLGAVGLVQVSATITPRSTDTLVSLPTPHPGAAFTELFVDTKSPDVTLFKLLKTSWDSLDLCDTVLPKIPTTYLHEKEKFLAYINHLLEADNLKNLPRCDYKEFLELAKLILGESIERKKGYTFTIQRPGADHHARWMSKSIYILKMTLLLHQLPDMHWQTKKKVEKMALFVIFVYLRSWFSAPALTSAATNDIDLFKRLQKFRTIHKKVSSTTSNLLQHHTWYLTEELISVSLFDETLPEDTRNLLAAQIGSLTP